MAMTARSKASQSHFPILALPEEILSSILDLAINAETHPGNEFKNRLKATAWLSETCQQFRDTLTPKLYSELHLVPNVVDEHNQVVLMDLNDKGRISTSRLHRTLTSNPQLGTHCKTLEVWFDQTKTLCVPLKEFILSEATFDFISLLGNTTCLSIDGLQSRPCDTHSESVFRFVCTALSKLPKLRTLRLLGQDIPLPFVVNVMCYITRHSTSLSVLEFGQIGPRGSISCLRALKELEGTGAIISLTMDEFCHSPEALEAIVRWPRNLETLSIFPRIFYDPSHTTLPFFTGTDFEEWNFATVQPILETQMANLRELSILPLCHGRDQVVPDIENLDLTGFTKLEVLTLPSFQTGYDTRHIPRILARNVRIFNWLVPLHNSVEEEEVLPDGWVIPEEGLIPDDPVSPHERIEDFDQKQEDWVRAMVKFAAKKKHRLREINIAFNDQERGYGDDQPGLIYPCERLERIGRDSKEFGIMVRY